MQPIVAEGMGRDEVNRQDRNGRAGAEFWKHQFSAAGEELVP